MVAGVGGRAPIALVLLVYRPSAMVNSDTFGGYDLMISNAVWLLLLSNCTATLSVDCWRRDASN